jgi:hypothetical protein
VVIESHCIFARKTLERLDRVHSSTLRSSWHLSPHNRNGFPKSMRTRLTSPSFCTTANERVYITTLLGNGAKGGSQGAVGDRRAALCGANAAGAGGL